MPENPVPNNPVLLSAIGCSPGRVCGQLQTSTAAALQACAVGASAESASAGNVILALVEATPADQYVMSQVAGIITLRGGFSSHAAIVARSLGIPAVCDVQGFELADGSLRVRASATNLQVDGTAANSAVADGTVANSAVADGTIITIDGSTGEVWLGDKSVVSDEAGSDVTSSDVTGSDVTGSDVTGNDVAPTSQTDTVTDPVQAGSNQIDPVKPSPVHASPVHASPVHANPVAASPMEVFANADNRQQAESARKLGAAGIGLCRVEHIVNAPALAELVRQLVGQLTTSAGEPSTGESSAGEHLIEALTQALRKEFAELLEGAGGLPVTVRLLDAALDELTLSESTPAESTLSESTLAEQAPVTPAPANGERNPMLGIRGIRLAHLRPALYQAQVRALAYACADYASTGSASTENPDSAQISSLPKILLPMVSTAAELAAGVKMVKQTLEQTAKQAAVPIGTGPIGTGPIGTGPIATVPIATVQIGAMIETPRAALIADQLAQHVDFFSIGTNDLTQFTFGFSRDDLDSRLIGPYVEAGLLDSNPFMTLDEPGVGELIAMACQRGRSVKPDLEIVLCGEHGADPASIALAHKLGVTAISCATHGLVTAKIAAARITAAAQVAAAARTTTAAQAPPADR